MVFENHAGIFHVLVGYSGKEKVLDMSELRVKEYEELSFTDDFMFCKDIISDGKGVRLDVYLEDDANTVFDIEMQTATKKNLPKRTRYYQGMIDLNLIEKGSGYEELKRSYIIFICMQNSWIILPEKAETAPSLNA